jgi:hypothetical protein
VQVIELLVRLHFPEVERIGATVRRPLESKNMGVFSGGLPVQKKTALDRGKALQGSGSMWAARSWSAAYPAVTSTPMAPACAFEQVAAAYCEVLAALTACRAPHPKRSNASRRTGIAQSRRVHRLMVDRAGRPPPQFRP